MSYRGFLSTYTQETRAIVPRRGWTLKSRRYLVERGDIGLGRDAYGPPRRERDRRGYGPGPYPSDDGYPDAGEDDAAEPGRPVDVEEDDYGQLLRRPGEMPPRHKRLRQPGRPHPGQPGWYPPGGPPNGGPGNGMPGNGMPGGGQPGQGTPGGGGPPNGPPHGRD